MLSVCDLSMTQRPKTYDMVTSVNKSLSSGENSWNKSYPFFSSGKNSFMSPKNHIYILGKSLIDRLPYDTRMLTDDQNNTAC